VFYLRVVEGLTFTEIGERVGVTHQAIKWTWNVKIIPALRGAAKCWY
jgi:transcriptional regulator with XRE-family HTH domain